MTAHRVRLSLSQLLKPIVLQASPIQRSGPLKEAITFQDCGKVFNQYGYNLGGVNAFKKLNSLKYEGVTFLWKP